MSKVNVSVENKTHKIGNFYLVGGTKHLYQLVACDYPTKRVALVGVNDGAFYGSVVVNDSKNGITDEEFNELIGRGSPDFFHVTNVDIKVQM